MKVTVTTLITLILVVTVTVRRHFHLVTCPRCSKVNPSDCVDMECDAKKKSTLKDLDGSLLGAVGSVIPQAEYEWDGDPRRGLGDYRIPSVLLTFPNGSRIPVEQVAPYKGRSFNFLGGVSFLL